jgi:hypothetical protein
MNIFNIFNIKIEFAEIYLMLSHYAGTLPNGRTHRDRFNYILDQYDTTPGFITREYGEQVFNRLNKYNKFNNQSKSNCEYHWNKLDDGTGRFVF